MKRFTQLTVTIGFMVSGLAQDARDVRLATGQRSEAPITTQVLNLSPAKIGHDDRFFGTTDLSRYLKKGRPNPGGEFLLSAIFLLGGTAIWIENGELTSVPIICFSLSAALGTHAFVVKRKQSKLRKPEER